MNIILKILSNRILFSLSHSLYKTKRVFHLRKPPRQTTLPLLLLPGFSFTKRVKNESEIDARHKEIMENLAKNKQKAIAMTRSLKEIIKTNSEKYRQMLERQIDILEKKQLDVKVKEELKKNREVTDEIKKEIDKAKSIIKSVERDSRRAGEDVKQEIEKALKEVKDIFEDQLTKNQDAEKKLQTAAQKAAVGILDTIKGFFSN